MLITSCGKFKNSRALRIIPPDDIAKTNQNKSPNTGYIEKKKEKKTVSKTETKKRKSLEIQIKQIIEFVEKNNEITRIDLENMLNIKESRARELLRYSVENNILEKLGKTRNIKYVKK